MSSTPFSFANASGFTLDGRLAEPGDGAASGTILFAHCFTCTKSSKAAIAISRSLAGAGWRVLRFDFTGLGDSAGDFATAGFATNVDDIVAAASALAEAGHPPSVLVGHSLGGAAVIAASSRVSSARAVVTIGTPFHVEHALERLGEGVAEVRAKGLAEVEIGGRQFRISRDFVESLCGQPQAERLHELRKALLVMHSPTDALVGIDNARQIFEAARHPKSFVALDGADHLLLDEGAAEYAAGLIAAWARPYAA